MIARRHFPFAVALAIGLSYALLARFVFNTTPFEDGGLLTFAFLVLMPIGLGALTAHFVPRETTWGWRRIAAPFLVVLLFLAASLLFNLEGLICVLIICPLFLLEAFVGAILYTSLADPRDRPRDKTLVVAGFALLPYLAVPAEQFIAAPDTFRRVENAVLIEAPATVVWQHIVRVAPIESQELRPDFIDVIGFPRPVEATLTHEGVGGVRHATFEHGVEFIETIDDWQPLERLSFSIVPNTATIPPTTFDEHVTVGGKFFDVLRGTYELQPAGPGRTRLVLHSRQRLSTHLNWYAGLWTSFVMSEIQQRILEVLKRQLEITYITFILHLGQSVCKNDCVASHTKR